MAVSRTPSPLDTLEAVRLENARLRADLEREVAAHRQTRERLAAVQAAIGRRDDDAEAATSWLRRDLIANVSHDLRTPLVAMRGYLEVLASRGDTLSAEQRRRYLGVAARQSERLGALVDELFELVKLDYAGAALQCEAFCLAELAGDVAQKFLLAAQGRQVAIEVDAAASAFVHADLGLIERVLDNLIGNSLRHTPPGGRIRLSAQVDGERIVVRVIDTGCGIAEADRPYIFERRFRGTNAAAGARGESRGGRPRRKPCGRRSGARDRAAHPRAAPDAHRRREQHRRRHLLPLQLAAAPRRPGSIIRRCAACSDDSCSPACCCSRSRARCCTS